MKGHRQKKVLDENYLGLSLSTYLPKMHEHTYQEKHDLEKKSWVLLKKDNQNDKIEINKRVKTILKTIKKNTDE